MIKQITLTAALALAATQTWADKQAAMAECIGQHSVAGAYMDMRQLEVPLTEMIGLAPNAEYQQIILRAYREPIARGSLEQAKASRRFADAVMLDCVTRIGE